MVLILLLFVSSSLFGQVAFHHLATTDDGKQLYFSSSLRVRNTDQFGHDKIFCFNDGGVQLYAQEEHILPEAQISNPYLLSEPDVSGDGAFVSYVAWRTCYGGSACVFADLNQSHILGAGQNLPMTFSGRTRISKNRRYALQFGATGFHDSGVTLIDLATGERTAVAGSVLGWGRQCLTSDGSVVVYSQSDPNAVGVWIRSGATRIPTTGRPGGALVNDRKTVLVYEQAPSGETAPRNLYAVELVSGRQTLLASEGTAWYQPSISNDGHLILYLAAPATGQPQQVFAVGSNGMDRRQLTDSTDGINEAILAGDGSVAYAASRDGRLLRIDLTTGTVRDLTGRSPLITVRQGAAAPGSMNWIQGLGLAGTTEVATYPLPDSLAGVRVKLGGLRARVLLVSPTEVRYQIPFETAAGDSSLELSPGGSVFEQLPPAVRIESQLPRFIRFGYEVPATQSSSSIYAPVAIHGDFSALVTDSSPAAPGETVIFYMTGLGAVTPGVASGQPAPLDSLAWATAPLACWQSEGDLRKPLHVGFAGLAPGFVGIYQVNVQMPSDAAGGAVYMECASGDSPPEFTSVPIRVTTP